MKLYFTYAGLKLIMLIIFQFKLYAIKAQEIFTQPSAKLITKFKFEQLTGGVILLKATLDNYTDSFNFILDTGSGGISLDSTTSAELKLKEIPTDKTIRGIAGIKQVNYTMNHKLNMPGLSVDSLDFHINNYDILSSVHGIRIDGVIGYSVLRRYIVYVNYDSMQLSFFTPGNYKYFRGGTLLHPTFNNLPIQGLTLKNNDRNIKHRFYLDTGGGLCVLLSKDFADDSCIFPKNRKLLPVITEGLGGKKQMQITTLRELKMGPYKFRKVPTYVFDDEYNVTSYPSLGGLIGAELLKRFNITLNYPKAEIHLMPNAHFNDPFDYSYTGMELFYEAGKILVGEIMENSPAAKAGLHTGDQIFSLDNNIAVSFQHIKTLLQSTDSRIKMIILRNGLPMELKMKIGSFD